MNPFIIFLLLLVVVLIGVIRLQAPTKKAIDALKQKFDSDNGYKSSIITGKVILVVVMFVVFGLVVIWRDFNHATGFTLTGPMLIIFGGYLLYQTPLISISKKELVIENLFSRVLKRNLTISIPIHHINSVKKQSLRKDIIITYNDVQQYTLRLAMVDANLNQAVYEYLLEKIEQNK